MKTSPRKTALFLGADQDVRCRRAVAHFNAVAGRMGLPWLASAAGLTEVTPEELERSDRVVAVNEAEHLAALRGRFPDRAAKIECWQVAGTTAMMEEIEREVEDLIARILSGDVRQKRPPGDTPSKNTVPPGKKPVLVKVGRETAGRRGKGVTTIFDTPLKPDALQELAAILKLRCGTGGTVKDGRIEIQGDQRERIIAELEKLGYAVKRAGG